IQTKRWKYHKLSPNFVLTHFLHMNFIIFTTSSSEYNHIHRLNNIEKQYGNDSAEIPDPVSSDDSGAMTSGDVRETPAVEEPPPEEISTFDEIYMLYINDPGDHDLMDDEDDVAGIQSMADFLQDISPIQDGNCKRVVLGVKGISAIR
ncbi:hypothetical protein EV401DRAFT_1890739, partial [Pisolithus croceorrhizus]